MNFTDKIVIPVQKVHSIETFIFLAEFLRFKFIWEYLGDKVLVTRQRVVFATCLCQLRILVYNNIEITIHENMLSSFGNYIKDFKAINKTVPGSELLPPKSPLPMRERAMSNFAKYTRIHF